MDPNFLTKVLIFLGAFLALLMAGRMAGRISHREDPSAPPPLPPPEPEPVATAVSAAPPADPSHPEPVIVPDSLRSRDGSPLELRAYYFEHCDARVGPPDPEVLFDDLHLDVCDPRTGSAWQPSFTIATPRGLAQELREKGWDYLEGDGMLIVPRFNVEAMLKAAMQQLTDQFDAASDPQDEDSQAPLT